MSTAAKRGLEVVGQSRRRVDVRSKVTGQARFADDLTAPRMLHCKLLRSPHPHAVIEAIDATRARAFPGVHLILTGKDFPVPFGVMPISLDEYPLAPERVRYVGDPVAAVVAKDEKTAEEALELITVTYRQLPTISSPEEALANPHPRIHDYGQQGNIHRNHSMQFGDAEEALSKSDHVFEDLFFYEGNTHMALEQQAALASVDGDGKLTLASNTQCPHYLHGQMEAVLQMPGAQIRIIAVPNGGGFGGRVAPAGHEMVVSKAALMLGRPVKICLSRQEVFYQHRGRHPVIMRFRTGVTKDGKLTAMHLQTLLDGGAYGSHGVPSAYYTGVLTPITYELPRYKFDACRVFTNKPACGPKRGHGAPQPRFGQEVQLDKIAAKLGLDPAEMRLAMVTKPDTLTANWLRIGSTGLAECIRQVVERSGWKDKHGKLPEGRGIGIAASTYLSGVGTSILWNKMPHSGVQLLLDRSGQVTVFCGATEIGQGSDDVLAATVAEVLGISTDNIRCVTGDTATSPVDLGSYSSRVTLMMGNAAIQAAERVREMIAIAVAAQLDTMPEQVIMSHGRVFAADDPNKSMSFIEAVVMAETQFGTLGTVGSYSPPPLPGKYKGSGVGTSPAYSFSACVVETEVDSATGMIHIVKVWSAHDVGRAINPMSVRGQVIGSVYMGLSEALMEEQSFRRLPAKLSSALVHKCPSVLEYKSLTSADMPEVEVILVEDPDANGPFGAKEAGQGPLLPVMPAVANAIWDAVGVRIDEIPITPDKVLRALELKREGKNPRVGPEYFPEVPYPEAMVVLPPWEGGDGRETKKVDGSPKKRATEATAS